MRGGKYLAWLLGVLLFGSLTLAGCATASGDNAGGSNGIEQTVNTVKLPNGKSVVCVFEQTNYHNGGPSCDWEHSW